MSKALRRVLQIGLAHKKYVFLLITLGAVSTLLSAAVPFYIQSLIENLGKMNTDDILKNIGIILLLYTASTIVYLYSGFVSNFAETKAAAWLKRKLFISTLLSENINPGDALSRIQSDTEIVGRMGMSLIPAIIIEAFSLIIGVTVIFRLNPYLGAVTLLTLPVYGLSLRAFIHGLKLASSEERKRYSESVTAFKEGIDGRLDIKTLDAFDYLIKRVSERLDRWVNASKRVAFYSTASYGLQSYLSTILPLLVLLSGIVFVKNGMATLSSVIATFTYLGRVYYPVERFAFFWSSYHRAVPIIERIWEFIEIEPFLERSTCTPEDWDIELQGVSLSREGSQVLKEISERIAFGKNLGIVGPSGVGKTTLALIISGIIRPTKGKVKIGKCPPESLLGRELIYVPSQPYLFEGTVRENIALGKNLTDSEIVEILKTVELEELNPDLPIEEGGKNLSLGQRQRIALARALARNPRIMILDEATSGMDSEREARILQRLRKMEMTLIIISHRLSTVRDMEEIWVLDDGRILCRGRHEELFRSCEKYRELFKEQEKGKDGL
ncbi:ABC-type multidrug transport system, ATPase and permease components [Thermococcus kodakarensis KOD1]|uniref:ABC-type multidrug transport system, ATPase and permease components n=1 Tax=Thermococcus kodakarensis (strain ATCC BAA-918 / JCM 12380 / KOD1) TaxID=69014 RepID=Q5JEZ9_THEKO|nr:ABC transporter ATP-binding protein [Thermococcus kodakarensis]WCN28710.1 ABC transporter ATP-binding protein [Thermococcus kodakarensis]WCN31008.1 ABC transporter ATP-binding protein [Thermococcus kodakarensis]BAD84865.1 ABC-type multidrug transport system, ATPase and permease components [Thermococcus kodakarensis KOD1]